MSGFAVYYRRTDGTACANGKRETLDEVFPTKEEAKIWADARNNKPFTPFFFWTVEIGI